MSDTLRYESRRALLAGDRYLAFLAIVLLGYAVMGKGFAYLGFPPLYVGEIAFLGGMIVFLRTGASVGALATVPAVLLVALMALVLARTLPFFGLYGFDSLRDSTVVIYGGFAFIVIGLLLEDARRINLVLRHYRIMLASLPALFVGLLLNKYWEEYIPQLYGPAPIVNIGPSAVGTHLVGIMVFALIGYRKVSVAWVLVWFATLALVSATNRGAMLSVVLPITFAMLMLGRFRLMLTTVGVGLAILAALLTLESIFGEYNEAKQSWERPVSAHQIVENAMSTIGQSGHQGEGTKKWRERWWDTIIQDTINGPNFWTGRGFGLNIAEEDGFAGPEKAPNGESRALTRSPHSAHMTLLARAGIPGLVLWALVLVSWFGMMMKAILTARARGHKQWADLFLFIGCYAAAIVINATFDVVLEGPVQGIWFWCLFGFGVGSVMIYRAQPFISPGGAR
jgi:O-antigen ligase/polysaccharide polymerase Wzy-like membrane protein